MARRNKWELDDDDELELDEEELARRKRKRKRKREKDGKGSKKVRRSRRDIPLDNLYRSLQKEKRKSKARRKVPMLANSAVSRAVCRV